MNPLHLIRTNSNDGNSLSKICCTTTFTNWEPIEQNLKTIPTVMWSSSTSICWWSTSILRTHQPRPVLHRFSKIARSRTTCSGLSSSQIQRYTRPSSTLKSQLVTGTTSARRGQQPPESHTSTWNAAILTSTDKYLAKFRRHSEWEPFKVRSELTASRHFPSRFIGAKKRWGNTVWDVVGISSPLRANVMSNIVAMPST